MRVNSIGKALKNKHALQGCLFFSLQRNRMFFQTDQGPGDSCEKGGSATTLDINTSTAGTIYFLMTLLYSE